MNDAIFNAELFNESLFNGLAPAGAVVPARRFGILTRPHFQRLEALRRVRHVLQAEEGFIIFLRRDSTNEFVQLVSISHAWTYHDRDRNGDRLPPGVRFELQVAEELLSIDDIKHAPRVKHGQQVFKILDYFEPQGVERFYRFYLAPLEEIL